MASLTFSALSSENASFDGAPSLEGTIDGFRYRLEDGELHIKPTQHFAEVPQAMSVIEPLLRSWEIDIALRFDHPELTFRYKTARVVDRDPTPGTLEPLQVEASGFMISSGNVTLKVKRSRFPVPPPVFRVSPDVETLWHRYLGYRQGQEPLPSMGYFCLTLLEAIAGSRPAAAQQFKISSKVLARLGQLTSEKGDLKTARKYPAAASGGPLSPLESDWIEAAIKAIIRRLGEINRIDIQPIITLNDLPPL